MRAPAVRPRLAGMKQFALPAIALSALVAGCAEIPLLQGGGTPGPAPQAATRPPLTGAPIRPEDLDTPTSAERQAAAAPTPASAGSLGVTIASLGDPARSGFWMETPLVSAPTKGSVLYRANGRRLNVDLIPIGGPATGGSRLSLSAMRMLDAPLTALPQVEVFAN